MEFIIPALYCWRAHVPISAGKCIITNKLHMKSPLSGMNDVPFGTYGVQINHEKSKVINFRTTSKHHLRIDFQRKTCLGTLCNQSRHVLLSNTTVNSLDLVKYQFSCKYSERRLITVDRFQLDIVLIVTSVFHQLTRAIIRYSIRANSGGGNFGALMHETLDIVGWWTHRKDWDMWSMDNIYMWYCTK